MKRTRDAVFSILYVVFLFLIFFNFGIHFFRTMRFNSTERTIASRGNNANCIYDLHARTGVSDSWLKRDVDVQGKITTLKGMTFDGIFSNGSDFEVSDWHVRINIKDDCFINKAWNGTVEIHQGHKVQTLNLMDFSENEVVLDGFYVDENFLIPLKAGDYIVYWPSRQNPNAELPVHAFNGNPGAITVGFIFYNEAAQRFSLSDYSVFFKFQKGYFQGPEPVIFTILLTIWLLLFVARLSMKFAYRRAEKQTEQRLNQQRMKDMEHYNLQLNLDVENKTYHIKEIQRKVVLGLANVIGNRDPDTGGHVKRTSDIIKIVVKEFRKEHPDVISDEKADDICRAAPMHDLGKIYIESSILCKPGKLTEEEYDKMKKHSENSGEIVKLILNDVEEPHFVETAFNVARHHHERWDGRGYPDKLAGEAIPLEARIMAIADVYDALVSRRCYKQSMSFDKAAEIMHEGMGSQFDPQMGPVFDACRETMETYYVVNNK